MDMRFTASPHRGKRISLLYLPYRQLHNYREEAGVNRLKELRRARGLSQDDLAEKVGMRQATISRIERGDPPAPRTVRKLSEFFGVSGEWLVGLEIPAEAVREKEPA